MKQATLGFPIANNPKRPIQVVDSDEDGPSIIKKRKVDWPPDGPSSSNPLQIKDPNFQISISSLPPRIQTNKSDLDLLVFHPLLTSKCAQDLFTYLRSEFPFYRVCYKKGPMQINTPRYTCVWGIDETEQPSSVYKIRPRPIPMVLQQLKETVEAATDATYNFVLVNYYQDGKDSISYHSDDESFLGPLPCIASLSLGGSRDFMMKHKTDNTQGVEKFKLQSGDMVVMRGTTQSKWLHAIPKRASAEGRINITFRKAIVKYGTDNYYRCLFPLSLLSHAQAIRQRSQMERFEDGRGAMTLGRITLVELHCGPFEVQFKMVEQVQDDARLKVRLTTDDVGHPCPAEYSSALKLAWLILPSAVWNL